MKNRSGFVSNSSSSSFIIATKGRAAKVTISINIEEYTEATIKTIEDLNDYYKRTWSDDRNDGYYEKCRKAIEDGFTVYIGSCSSEGDDPVERMLCEHGFNECTLPKGGIVIQGEGGY